MTDFDMWAELYRTWTDIAAGSQYDEDIAYYHRLAASVSGPVADLGIGIGRVAAVIKPDYGVDISADMLTEAARRIGNGTILIQASITDFRLPNPAALQYCAQNTLNHVAGDQQPAVFACAYRNSAPGGLFVLETAPTYPQRPRHRDRIPALVAWGNRSAVYIITELLDGEGRRARVIGLLEELDETGTVMRRRYFPPIYFTFPAVEDVVGWARAAGFEVEAVYADFSGTPFESGARRAVLHLRRPAGAAVDYCDHTQ